MEEKTRNFELRTGEGQVIFSFYLAEKEIAAENTSKRSETFDQGGEGGKETSALSTHDSPMTEAQRRYLFRILADHGIQGDIAHQELKNAFGVNGLTEVSKFEASRMIERLLGEGIGGFKNGPPIQ